MNPLAEGEVTSLEVSTLQLRFLSLQSHYDNLRDTKQDIPDWILLDIFACRNEIERRGAPTPDFQRQKVEQSEEPSWLKKAREDRASRIKAAPF